MMIYGNQWKKLASGWRSIVLAALLCCAFAIPGCGSDETANSTAGMEAKSTTTATVEETTSTTAATTTTTLRTTEAYAADMQAWFNEYDPKLAQGAEVLDPVFNDPLNVSEQELQDLEDFAGLVTEAAEALEMIEPTPDLASAHADYLGTFKSMASGLNQVIDPLKNKDLTAIQEALAPLSAASEQGVTARDTLINALGISPPSDTTSERTAGTNRS